MLSTIAAFLFALGILIAVHEFGHFWVARRLGVRVLRFSIGFGKPLWSRKGRDGTEYVLSALPLGGYVKMLDEREGEVSPSEVHLAFNRQSVTKRMAIVAAGPAFNFIFAIAAFWLLLMIGIPGLKPVIGNVEEKSPAAVAGLLKGDVILSIEGSNTPTWESASLALIGKSLDKEKIEVQVRRGGSSEQTVALYTGGLMAELGKQDPMQVLGLQPMLPAIPPVVGNLLPDGAGAKAGLQSGDRLLQVDGQALSDWLSWVKYVRARPQQALMVQVQRGSATLTLSLTPAGEAQKDGSVVGKIGAMPKEIPALGPEQLTKQHYSPFAALIEGCIRTWDMSVMTLRLLGRMVIGQVSLDNVSGPITIADYAGKSANSGLVAYLSFLAIISISLAVLNLLPIPVLDGGHLFYYVIEAVKGSPLSDQAQVMGQRIGIMLLAMLMVLAFYNDLSRLFG